MFIYNSSRLIRLQVEYTETNLANLAITCSFISPATNRLVEEKAQFQSTKLFFGWMQPEIEHLPKGNALLLMATAPEPQTSPSASRRASTSAVVWFGFFPDKQKQNINTGQTRRVSSLRHTWVRWLGKSNVNHRSLACHIYPVSPLPPSLLDSKGPALLNYSSHWGEDRSMHGFSTPCLFPFSLCL